MVVVLGIDPGTAHTGYGVVLAHGGTLAALDGGVLRTDAHEALEQRLAEIHARVSELIERHEPEAVAVGELFFWHKARRGLWGGPGGGGKRLGGGEGGET